MILKFDITSLNGFHRLGLDIQIWSEEELYEICDMAKRLFCMAKSELLEKDLYEYVIMLACEEDAQWEKILSLSKSASRKIHVVSIDLSAFIYPNEEEPALLQCLLNSILEH
ncbi:hypothetical protein [Fluoribacter gormanii]|uniref:hypothetical protein n=1 Tax=Fluoribacter gormanii TaxID=464 RepID=UPI00104184D5|nr:hypothetical protein [Fluoribacter gormanii]